MTVLEFLDAHRYPASAPILDSVDVGVNILYNDYLEGSSTVSRIDAVAIRITSSNLSQLQQATSLNLKFTDPGSVMTIHLDDPNVKIQRSIVNNYYIFIISPSDQSKRPTVVLVSATQVFDSPLLIEPEISVDALVKNQYNVLLNSDVVSRTSDFRRECDRLGSTVHPSNLSSILSDQASLAHIQDSMYSDTGWTNGRYQGSSTDADHYGGISATITGIPFEGAFYSKGTSDTVIRDNTQQDRVYNEYFYSVIDISGSLAQVTPLPAVPTSTGLSFTLGSPLSETDTLVVLGGLLSTNKRVKVGSFIKIDTEVLRVSNIINTSQPSYWIIQVERGVQDTKPFSHSSPATIFLIENSSVIFKLEGNKVQTVPEGKIYIKDSTDILHIEKQGYSTTGSFGI